MATPFVLKKVISAFLKPLSILFITLLFAVWIRKKSKRASNIIAVCALGVLYVLSLSPIADRITRPLENTYVKYDNQAVKYVLVLGGGHSAESRLPVSSMLHRTSLARLVEGIHIYRQNPGSKLLLSGYKASQYYSHASVAKKVAVAMGVNERDIVLAETVKDTEEEAAHWSQFIKSEAFALVTSASHMPRSVELFHHYLRKTVKEDFFLVPAPTDFRSSIHSFSNWRSWVPKARALETVERAWHEYLGMLWNKIRL